MRPGTLVELPDGRRGRVVYHGLDGYGIRWGEQPVDLEKINSVVGNTLVGFDEESLPDFLEEIEPQAMLRNPYRGAALECVGDDYTAIPEDPS